LIHFYKRKKNEESKKSAEEQSSSETVRPKKEDLHLEGNEYVEDKVRVAPFVDLEGQDDLDNLSSFLESNLGARCTLSPQTVEEPTPQKNLRPSRTPLKGLRTLKIVHVEVLRPVQVQAITQTRRKKRIGCQLKGKD